MTVEPLVWQRFEWRSGADIYRFEVQQGGLFGTITAPGERSTTLPMVAWQGLLEAVQLSRKSLGQPSRLGLPARAGLRWSETESGELEQAFRSGQTIPELARAHSRTSFAIETQLERLGLWNRAEHRPAG
jgi:hypothetical protein